MSWHWLAPKDQRANNWLLYDESTRGVALREQYADLACRRCKKLDERAALERGIDASVTIQSKADFLASDDGFLLMSRPLVDWLLEVGAAGVVFLALPGDDRYRVAIGHPRASVDTANCGMQFLNRCGVCGRFRETCLFPQLSAMALPEQPLAFAEPDIPWENTRGRMSWFLASPSLAQSLKQQKFKGFELLRAN